MKKFVLLMLLPAIFSCRTGKEETRIVKKYSIDQFYKNINIGGGSFSSDESKLLATSNQSGIYNVRALPVDGSAPVQLTNSDKESFFGISYFPDDDRFIFTHDFGGDENDQLFIQNPDSSVINLTPWEGSKSSFFGWARDFKSFFITSNKRDPKYFDLYEVSLESLSPVLFYENKEGYDIAGISDNKNFIALIENITTTNSEMYLFDREKPELKHISEHDGDATYSPQYFDIMNEYLYYLTDEGSEFTYLSRYKTDDGTKEKVWATDWDIYYVYESFNEKYRVTGINQDAQTVIRMTNLETGEDVILPEFPGSNIQGAGISRSEKKLRLSVGASTSPNNIYVYDLESKELKKITNTLNPEIDENDLVNAEVVRYPSYDGLEIPSILFKPHSATPKNKVPALVWVHGGPGGQSRVGYFSLLQFLANHDYAIIAVNNRGSSGYGKTFFKMDDQKHGDVDLKDCVSAKNYLAGLGWVDTSRVGIIGGSYGGYMVMAALTFEPEAFSVGVNIFGVTNWLRTLKSIPPYWESFKKALYTEMGDPFTDDSIRLYRFSPLFHAKNVTKPLMVLQGANDPRVLQVESDEIVESVKANGVPVEYILFPDEGHGFVKKENEIKGYGQILVFLDKYLKGSSME